MPPIDTRERVVRWRRLLAGGVLLTVLAGAVGAGLELWWFGPTDASAARRVELDVHQRFAAMVRSITEASARVTTDARAAAGLAAGLEDAGRRALFDLVAETRARSEQPAEIAITIYDKAIVARAWSGASSDIPDERIAGPSTLFVTPSPLGLRLVHLQPIAGSDGSAPGIGRERARALAGARGDHAHADRLHAADEPRPGVAADAARRRRRSGAAGGRGAARPSGEPLAEAWVDPETLRAARNRWRRQVAAVMVALLAATVLVLIGPLLDRRIGRDRRVYVRTTLGGAGLDALRVVCCCGWRLPSAAISCRRRRRRCRSPAARRPRS